MVGRRRRRWAVRQVLATDRRRVSSSSRQHEHQQILFRRQTISTAIQALPLKEVVYCSQIDQQLWSWRWLGRDIRNQRKTSLMRWKTRKCASSGKLTQRNLVDDRLWPSWCWGSWKTAWIRILMTQFIFCNSNPVSRPYSALEQTIQNSKVRFLIQFVYQHIQFWTNSNK
jgi:hypothetical protein